MKFYLFGTFVAASLILFVTPGFNLFIVLGCGISQGRQTAIVPMVSVVVGKRSDAVWLSQSKAETSHNSM